MTAPGRVGIAAPLRVNGLAPTKVSVAANSLKRASEEFKNRSRKALWFNDPVLWAKERLGMHLWSLQRDISNSVVTDPRTIVKSCHDSGKTFLAAILVCWWIDTRPAKQTMVVSTAPTAYQVNKLLWEYVRQLHKTHNLSGDVSEAAEWKSEGDRYIVGVGRKPADTNMHGIQGIHRKYVFVVIDEACGVASHIWTGIDAITTNPENRVLAIGNPDDPATEFGKIFLEDQPGWNKFTIAAKDTPNFTSEKWELPDGMAELLLDPEWVYDKERRWGKNSSRYIAKVDAEFPEESFDTLFPPKKLMEAVDRDIEELGLISTDTDLYLGVDVARFGGDLSTVISNYGGKIRVEESWSGKDLVEAANRVDRIARRTGAKQVRVDATGLGAGVVDTLRTLCFDSYIVFEMVGSERSPDHTRWINARAWWHDTFLEKLNKGLIDLPQFDRGDSDESKMYEDLEVIRYQFKKGSLQIESKDEIRKRVKKSPDFSDAVVYACADLDPNALDSLLNPGEVVMLDPMEPYADRGYAISMY